MIIDHKTTLYSYFSALQRLSFLVQFIFCFVSFSFTLFPCVIHWSSFIFGCIFSCVYIRISIRAVFAFRASVERGPLLLLLPLLFCFYFLLFARHDWMNIEHMNIIRNARTYLSLTEIPNENTRISRLKWKRCFSILIKNKKYFMHFYNLLLLFYSFSAFICVFLDLAWIKHKSYEIRLFHSLHICSCVEFPPNYALEFDRIEWHLWIMPLALRVWLNSLVFSTF